jgi:carboxymethylenebutenolidase
MSGFIELTSADGHRLGAYQSRPDGAARGAVVVLQEIFGVNSHIRAVCDRLAALRYHAIAPALFDRQSPGFEAGYSPEDVARGREVRKRLDLDQMLLDVAAAIGAVQASAPVAVMGFCLGGSLAFLSATRLPGIACAVSYYGSMVASHAGETPRVPTLMHFGETDHSIPLSDVETTRARRPDCTVHVYPAGHGFNCDERPSFHAASAALAWTRSMDWLDDAFRRALMV